MMKVRQQRTPAFCFSTQINTPGISFRRAQPHGSVDLHNLQRYQVVERPQLGTPSYIIPQCL